MKIADVEMLCCLLQLSDEAEVHGWRKKKVYRRCNLISTEDAKAEQSSPKSSQISHLIGRVHHQLPSHTVAMANADSPDPSKDLLPVNKEEEEVDPLAPAPEPKLPTRKDTSLKEFLSKMDDYAPIVSPLPFYSFAF